MKNKKSTFVFRMAGAHTIAYFVAGIFAVVFMNYREHYASNSLGLLMHPVDSPIVALGPSLNILRGIVLGFILLPIRTIILGENGFLKLSIITLGLSYISTIGPTPGSFDSFIYTKLPMQYHLLGIPETLLYIVLFAGIQYVWYKSEKKYFNIIAIMLVLIIILLSVAGYIQAKAMLN